MSRVIDFNHYRKFGQIKYLTVKLTKSISNHHFKVKSRLKSKSYYQNRYIPAKKILDPLMNQLDSMTKQLLGL